MEMHLIVAFNSIRKMNFGSAAIVASLAKYFFLYLSSIFIIKTILPNNLAMKAMATMMAWPQLVTALAGAVIAFGIIRIIKKDVDA